MLEKANIACCEETFKEDSDLQPPQPLCALNLDQAKHAPRGRRRGEREVAAPPLPRHRHPPRPAQERAAAGWRERGSTPRAAQRRPPAARTPRSTPERPRRAACTLRPPRTGHLPPRGRLRAHPAPRAHLSGAPPAPGSGGRPAPPRRAPHFLVLPTRRRVSLPCKVPEPDPAAWRRQSEGSGRAGRPRGERRGSGSAARKRRRGRGGRGGEPRRGDPLRPQPARRSCSGGLVRWFSAPALAALPLSQRHRWHHLQLPRVRALGSGCFGSNLAPLLNNTRASHCYGLSRWEDWENSVSACSLCTEPWGNSQLRSVSFFATDHKSHLHQSQDITGCVLWVADTKLRVLDVYKLFLWDNNDLEQQTDSMMMAPTSLPVLWIGL
nr:atherin-like [Globicephala melas]